MGFRVTFALADSSATKVASEAVPWMTPPPWLSGPNRKAYRKNTNTLAHMLCLNFLKK